MHRIGYLGPAGTFTEEAAQLVLQSYPRELVGYHDVPDLIMAVQDHDLDFAVVPIENVIEGTVNVTIDMLTHQADVKIVGERIIPIHQCLVAQASVSLGDIVRIVSHPQALAQCRRFLQEHFSSVQVHSANSTAAGAL